MPIFVSVLLTIAILIAVVIAYSIVARLRKDQRRRARWLAGDDR